MENTKIRKNAIRDENNFDGKTISSDIVKNRRKIASKLALRYDITPEILAEYFQVPIKTIRKDIEEANIQFIGELEFIVNKEKNTMRNKILQKIENGMDKQDALAKMGMWSDVVLFGEEVKITFRGLDTEQLSRMQKALDLCAYGYSETDVIKMTDLNKVEKELMKSQLKDKEELSENGRKTFLKGADVFAKERYAKGEDAGDIKNATGVPESLVSSKYYGKYKDKYQEKASKKRQEENKPSKDALKEEAYNRWMNKECTQQELADEYNVTRITVMNWCREMKAKHMLERPEMALRQRNIKRELKEQRDDKKEKSISLYLFHKENGMNHSDAVYKVAEELKTGYGKVLQFLREEGLAPTGFERQPNAERTKKEDKHFKDGYDMGVLAHFGYGPNTGKSGYGVNEDGKMRVNKEYVEVVTGQRQVSYEITNEPEFTTHIRENDGVIGDYWKQKKQKKNEEKVSNKTFGNAKHREAEREKDIGIEKEDDKIL